MAYYGEHSESRDTCGCGAYVSNRGHAQWMHVRSRRHINWLRERNNSAYGDAQLADRYERERSAAIKARHP
jgi:hypothetical protein